MGARLPRGWTVWNEEQGGQLVLAFRPDVFDSSSFPPACLPTITVARGSSPDQRLDRRAKSESWYCALYLEPTVRVRDVDETRTSREAAVAAARDLARAFVAGEVDYRSAYQLPREDYLDEIDSLVGTGEADAADGRGRQRETDDGVDDRTGTY